MSFTMLTELGRRFAEANVKTSIVARLALSGYSQDSWPDHHVEAAIQACNYMGADAAARA